MKILQLLNQPQLRGAEIFASQLSNYLIEQGHTSDLLAIYPGSLTHFPNGLEVKTLECNVSSRMFDPKGWKNLANLIRENRYDLIQSNAGNTLKFAVFSKMLCGWKTPILFRNANKIGDFINTPLKKAFNKFLVSQIDQVVSVSKVCEIDFRDTFRYSPSKIETVPIGIDMHEVPDSPPPDLKHLFGDGLVFVHVGSFVPEKNHKGLLSIFSRLKTRYPEAKLLLTGSGPLQQQFEAQVKGSDMENSVFFLGSRPDVLSIIKYSDLLLLPSLLEGLPGVILESFYCKTPVISYNVGGISQVVRSGETGWLIEKGNERAFTEAVTEATEDRENVNKIMENAYRLVISEYTNKVIAEKFMRTYMKTLGLPAA